MENESTLDYSSFKMIDKELVCIKLELQQPVGEIKIEPSISFHFCTDNQLMFCFLVVHGQISSQMQRNKRSVRIL